MTTPIMPTHSFSYEGARINVYFAKKGEGLPKHEHLYSHATYCTAGACVIRKEGKQVVIDKFSKPVNLTAQEWHEIEALEDGTSFSNVFSEAHNDTY
jgi:quercetin dioxygenase-like cupin family protein